jgi:hypothetical protein
MDDPKGKHGDGIRQKTANIHERLLALLLDVAPHVQDPGLSSEPERSTQISRPAMREWTENRLADFNLWVTGISILLARPGVSPSLHVFKPVIESLLMLLASFLDVCRNSGDKDVAFGMCTDTNSDSHLRHTDSQ